MAKSLKFEDTNQYQMAKSLIRRHKSMKDREHNGQKFENTKGVIRRMNTENTMAKSLKKPKE